jgi:hypothetical protein
MIHKDIDAPRRLFRTLATLYHLFHFCLLTNPRGDTLRLTRRGWMSGQYQDK